MRKHSKKMRKFISLFLMLCMCFTMTATAFAESGGSGSGLTNAEKEALYEEYLKAAEEMQTIDPTLTIIPKEEIAEEDWIPIDEFKKLLNYLSGVKFSSDSKTIKSDSSLNSENYNNATPYSTPRSCTKTKTVSSLDGENSITIAIKGVFETDYSEFNKRQLFSKVNSITSYKTGGGIGSWTQTGYECLYMDGGRTCKVAVSGVYKVGAASITRTPSVEFYCRVSGEIV